MGARTVQQDHYETLGVRRDASKDEIEAAWRRAVNFWHPDRNRSKEAVERLKAANLAREVLLDDEQRRRYDRTHVQRDWQPQPASGERMDPPAGRRPQRQRNRGTTHSRVSYASASASSSGWKASEPRAERDEAGPFDIDDESTGPPPERWSREWWRSLAESALSGEMLDRGNQQVVTLFDRRPRLARFVIVPLGLLAIVLAALLTVLVT